MYICRDGKGGALMGSSFFFLAFPLSRLKRLLAKGDASNLDMGARCPDTFKY